SFSCLPLKLTMPSKSSPPFGNLTVGNGSPCSHSSDVNVGVARNRPAVNTSTLPAPSNQPSSTETSGLQGKNHNDCRQHKITHTQYRRNAHTRAQSFAAKRSQLSDLYPLAEWPVG